MTTFFLLFLAAFSLFGCLAVVLALGTLLGRPKKRRCACQEAEAVLKRFEERRKMKHYDPKTVDRNNLPIVDSH